MQIPKLTVSSHLSNLGYFNLLICYLDSFLRVWIREGVRNLAKISSEVQRLRKARPKNEIQPLASRKKDTNPGVYQHF
jgi:hypothetical protein